jgi:tRNA nucleotidyltransferase/poly(A) polymerase
VHAEFDMMLQVQQLAGRCQIVGRRNPLALVHASNGRIIDVTSLEAVGSHDVAALAKQSSQVCTFYAQCAAQL